MANNPAAADEKAQHARNCELVELALRAGNMRVATDYIRTAQGDQAARAAVADTARRFGC